MNDIKLIDYLTQGSLFTAINALLPVEVSDIIAPDVLTMDDLILLNHGDKTVFNKLNTLPLDRVAALVVIENRDHWLNLVKINAFDFKVGATNIREVIETNVDVINSVNTRDDVSKVSAFNSDELIVNDGTNSVNNDNTNNDRNRNVLETTFNLSEAHNQLLLKSKSNIIQALIKDVSSFLTLSIY